MHYSLRDELKNIKKPDIKIIEDNMRARKENFKNKITGENITHNKYFKVNIIKKYKLEFKMTIYQSFSLDA